MPIHRKGNRNTMSLTQTHFERWGEMKTKIGIDDQTPIITVSKSFLTSFANISGCVAMRGTS